MPVLVTSSLFTEGWDFAHEGSSTWAAVTLPHDAMIHGTRTADADAWAHGAELKGNEVSLRFEGVYRHSRVTIDGHDVGGALSGYREFEVRLDPYLTPGFGNGATATEESFTEATHSTFRGRALAVIRSDGRPGQIRVTATSRSHGDSFVMLDVTEQREPA